MADDSPLAGIPPVEADPGVPPGVIEVRSGTSRVRGRFMSDALAAALADEMQRRAEADPAFAEEIKSVLESKDFITYSLDMTDPIRCECCGTLVAMVPEVHAREGGHPKPAIWEPGPWRKHTPRRCDAMRGTADA
jgi:hypothetical protein